MPAQTSKPAAVKVPESPTIIHGASQFIALLAQCLIERELRTAMTRHNIPELVLYHEDRASKAPTAARVFDLFADTARHHLTNRDGATIQVFEPELTDLQRHILALLAIPQAAYQAAATDS